LKLDARRLFLGPSEDPAKPNKEQWDIDYDVRYKSHKQSARHAERDGTAFASVALPAHFSAILAVFTHIAHRLGPEWKPDRVIDWHAGTGSGLW
jgi:ribosomal protein RSM22 (predicted rRNA methylase)